MAFDLYASEDVQAINNFYKKLFEQIPDLIFQFTIYSDNSCSFPLISKSAEEVFEMPVSEFSSASRFSILKKISPLDRRNFYTSLLKATQTLAPWEIEFRANLPRKGKRWLKVTSKPERGENGEVSFYGRILDITDSKDQELRLKISEERFQFALDASTVGIWDWDMVENNVFYSSLSLKILEQDSTDIFDNPEMWDKIVHPDDLEKYYSDIHEHFDNKIPYYENYHRVLTSSGKCKWILDRGKVIERDENGKPMRVIGTHTDVSAQKEKELALIKTMELYSEQNSRLINFSHVVTHNLNTQAGNIKLLLDLIEMQNDLEGNKEMLTHLRTVSNDLNETICNLTQVVDIQNQLHLEIKELHLNTFVKKTLGILKTKTCELNAEIVNAIPDEAFVLYNPAYLESVLLNFVSNSIKYAHPERQPKIEFCFEPEAKQGFASLTIKDNGLGIDLEKYGDLLFGMYKTFHQHKEARGIGLYITKNQIDSMKGQVEVQSTVNEGSVFTIFFNKELETEV
ncbi:sensor histidine kinase [Flavobacterium agrisoli]|uniref:histidine kinase n=1 Tax=Flavobacterium agrisoli TaxID=2793066 RepID=A0A934PNH2_9FLAO|nr:PAS domain-containing protein [Flavobacterium agrisoli]MBK0370777.1 PAS domain-containing protein [Flavobacterium agrisoli]